MSAPQSYSDLIYIGQIKKPHGLKGEVSALLLTDNHCIFDQIHQLVLIKNETLKEAALQYCFFMRNYVVAKLDCFDTVDQIKEWVDSYMAIPPYNFNEENGSYHIYQIYALRVIDEAGAVRGKIEDLAENNGNWIIVVRTEIKRVYVPFAEEYCKIDLQNGTLLIPDILWKQLYEL